MNSILYTIILPSLLTVVTTLLRKYKYYYVKFKFAERVRLIFFQLSTIKFSRKKISQKIKLVFDSKNRESMYWNNSIPIMFLPIKSEKSVELNDSKEYLLVDFPPEILKQVESYYPNYLNRKRNVDTLFNKAKEDLKKSFDILLVSSNEMTELTHEQKTNSLIIDLDKHIYKVANNILNRLSASKVCFNSMMYGIWDWPQIQASSLDKATEKSKEENKQLSKITIDLYRTDFFTFEVFQSIHREIYNKKEEKYQKNKLIQIKNEEELLRAWPFLCSFGLSLLLIVEGKKSEEILFTKRTEHYINSDEFMYRYHYSVNEAFSIPDKEDISTRLKISTCVLKGLHEELGINSGFIEGFRLENIGLYFSRSTMQIDICVALKLDNFYSKDILNLHKVSKDGEFESSDLVFIPYKRENIRKIIYDNILCDHSKLPRYKDSSGYKALTEEARIGLAYLYLKYPVRTNFKEKELLTGKQID